MSSDREPIRARPVEVWPTEAWGGVPLVWEEVMSRRVQETVEKMVLGVETDFKYGGQNIMSSPLPIHHKDFTFTAKTISQAIEDAKARLAALPKSVEIIHCTEDMEATLVKMAKQPPVDFHGGGPVVEWNYLAYIPVAFHPSEIKCLQEAVKDVKAGKKVLAVTSTKVYSPEVLERTVHEMEEFRKNLMSPDFLLTPRQEAIIVDERAGIDDSKFKTDATWASRIVEIVDPPMLPYDFLVHRMGFTPAEADKTIKTAQRVMTAIEAEQTNLHSTISNSDKTQTPDSEEVDQPIIRENQ